MSIWYAKPGFNRTKSVVESTQFVKFRQYIDAPETRGQYLPSESPDYPPIDSLLHFTGNELNSNFYYRIECKALFTGAPPVAFINEPTSGVTHGTHKITKFRFDNSVLSTGIGSTGYTGISLLNGSNVIADSITSIILTNSSTAPFASDHFEPKFFYQNDTDAVGYMVEIDHICSIPNVTTNNIPVALRWASAINSRDTTIVSGYLLATPVKVIFTDPPPPPT